MAGKSDIIDIFMRVKHRTEKAVLVTDEKDEGDEVWLPLSQIEIEMDDDPKYATISLPEWLALDKGLV